MVYDREGRKLWIVDETGAHRSIESWDEIAKRPRRADLPDWWVVARDISWRPPAGALTGLPEGWTGNSLLSMSPNAVNRAGADGSGGAGYKLGCGGKCQEQYDTATGKYVGSGGSGGTRKSKGGTGGGQERTKGEPTKTSAPAKTGSAPPRSHKAAGADSEEAHAKLPENNPIPPPGVNVDDNIREAEGHRGDLLWFKDQVDSKGPWDYKNNEEYKEEGPFENFGNFNYGATGAALGLSDEELYRAAGAKQIWDHPLEPEKRTRPFSFPYGDEYKDAEMIRRGIEYYRQQQLLKKL